MKNSYGEKSFIPQELRSGRLIDRYEHTNLTQALEGWGAAIAVGVSAAASIGSAALSASSADAAANVPYPKTASYDPVLAKQDQYAGIQGLEGAYQKYGGAAQTIANTENNWYQQSQKALAPGLLNGIANASKNAQQLVNGRVPTDVSQETARDAAQSALTGGFGADSGEGRNLVLRDLGIDSLQAQQTGLGELGQVSNLAKSLTPYSAADILGTSAGYQSNYDTYNLHNADVANQAARDKAGATTANNLASYQQQVAQATAPNPYVAGSLAGLGAIGSGLSSYYGRMSAGQPNSAGYFGSANAANSYYPGTSAQYTPGYGYQSYIPPVQGGGTFNGWPSG